VGAVSLSRPDTLPSPGSEINQRPVPKVETFEEVISEAMKGDRLLLLVRQGGHSRFIVLRLDD
jgi:hypothetical protein